MKINSFIYCIKEGVKNIWRHKIYSAASIATVAACIFIFGTFYFLLENVELMVKEAEEGVAITVFFDEDITEGDIKKIGIRLDNREDVLAVNYITADEAWDEFQATYFGDSPELAEGFDEDNPLANSSHYEVYLKDVAAQDELVEYVLSLDGVRKINQAKNVADMLENFNKLLYQVSISVISLLAAVSVFLIGNTITIGIHSRKEELAIMKIIGATNMFARLPFLIEGIVMGILGTMLPMIALFNLYNKLSVYVNTEFTLLSGMLHFIPAKELFIELLPISIAIGLAVSFVSSFFATAKHIKV